MRTDEDEPVDYGFDELDELAHAYAVTIHRSQGSEYPAVVIPLTTGSWMMLQRNLLGVSPAGAGPAAPELAVARWAGRPRASASRRRRCRREPWRAPQDRAPAFPVFRWSVPEGGLVPTSAG